MTRFSHCLATVVSCLICVSSLLATPPPHYRLAWADEFNGTALDTNYWNYYDPGKRRDAINVSGAISIKNGCLTITTFTRDGKQCTGMVDTRGKFDRSHGYWEARICFEDSPGMWSAFWLESPTIGRPVGNPAKAGTEIDICEHRAVGRNGEDLAGKVHQTLHWDGYGKFHKSAGLLTPDLKLDSGFHLYGLEWTSSAYRFYVDGQVTWTTTNAISSTNEFIILSSEIQNDNWAGKIPKGGYGDLSHSKTKMVVDYVRYYSHE